MVWLGIILWLLVHMLVILALLVGINLFFQARRERLTGETTEFFRKRSTAKTVFSPTQGKWLCTQCGQPVHDGDGT